MRDSAGVAMTIGPKVIALNLAVERCSPDFEAEFGKWAPIFDGIYTTKSKT